MSGLTAERIQLDDLKFGDWSPFEVPGGPATPLTVESARATVAEGARRVHAIFSRELLGRGEGAFDLAAKRVVSGTGELGRGRLRAEVANGRATIGPVEVEGAAGVARGSLVYEPRERDVVVAARVKVDHFDYGLLAQTLRPERTSTARSAWISGSTRRHRASPPPWRRFRAVRLRGVAKAADRRRVRLLDGEPGVPAAADRRRQRIADELPGGPLRPRARQAAVGAAGDRHGQHAHRGRRPGGFRDRRAPPPVRAAFQAAHSSSASRPRSRSTGRSTTTASACARPMRSARPRDGRSRRSSCRSSGSSASAFRATGATCARIRGDRSARGLRAVSLARRQKTAA